MMLGNMQQTEIKHMACSYRWRTLIQMDGKRGNNVQEARQPKRKYSGGKEDVCPPLGKGNDLSTTIMPITLSWN
jgi:hypothetical protein